MIWCTSTLLFFHHLTGRHVNSMPMSNGICVYPVEMLANMNAKLAKSITSSQWAACQFNVDVWWYLRTCYGDTRKYDRGNDWVYNIISASCNVDSMWTSNDRSSYATEIGYRKSCIMAKSSPGISVDRTLILCRYLMLLAQMSRRHCCISPLKQLSPHRASQWLELWIFVGV